VWKLRGLGSSAELRHLQVLRGKERSQNLRRLRRVALLEAYPILLQSRLDSPFAGYREFEETEGCWNGKMGEGAARSLE